MGRSFSMLAGAPPPPYGGSLFGPPAISAFNDDEPVELSPLDDGWEVVQEATNNGVLVLTTHCEHPAVARDAAQENFAVLVHAKAPVAAAEASERAPLDLVTVLDVSGSMSGSKLGLLKQAMGFVIDHLGPGDRLSIVAFSCRAHRIIRLTCMTDGGKALARDAVESLTANGSTNIGDGLRVAAEVIDGRRHGNPVSSVILLSDGQDNHTLRQGGDGPFGGAKSYIDLVPRSLRRGTGNGCSTVHTFGFGTDHDAAAMHAIAEVTGGTFSFIQNHAVVQDSFAQCTGGLLSVAVQEARVAVECLQAGRPVVVADTEPSVEVARERFHVEAAEDIAAARAAAERGAHAEAARILDRRQEASAAAGLAGDARCAALVAELRELSARVANRREYEQTGGACLLAGISSHASTVQLFGPGCQGWSAVTGVSRHLGQGHPRPPWGPWHPLQNRSGHRMGHLRSRTQGFRRRPLRPRTQRRQCREW
ncbi:hypothetical protein PAHAL_5G088100 [Panicum hallii]|uniref:VWFA domain-containing protein n=1 Tax=Panicum hallii TaxID=206008 RepID=A0A2T8IJH3_9POAL|nr:hypothetical protein PAHAL_5G088100 [Panicum hallii]